VRQPRIVRGSLPWSRPAAWVGSILRSGPIVPALVALALATGCDAGAVPATPPIVPGSSTAPREVNIVLKDWIFLPNPVDVVPGETVLLHVVNGGLEVHELVIGDLAVQDAWEAAELAAINAPPGPTPAISVPPAVAGIRVVVASGQRVDLTWQVPSSSTEVANLLFGCHIPSHWAKGMRADVVIAGAPAPSGSDGGSASG
jgi:uncharacterized cupredoxin-like copper-binding protein